MPFIHVRSLPFEPALDVASVLEAVSREFAQSAGVDVAHVHATWEFLKEGHYAVGGVAAGRQPAASHPVMVDLLSPGFNDAGAIETMLISLAASLAKHARIPRSKLFIHHRRAESGSVFDAGRVERW